MAQIKDLIVSGVSRLLNPVFTSQIISAEYDKRSAKKYFATDGTIQDIGSMVPHIGDNGNWFVGDDDTSVEAQGPKGDPGEDGTDVTPCGHWEAENTPYAYLSLVRMAYSTFICMNEEGSSNSPLGVFLSIDGTLMKYEDGTYVLVDDQTIHPDWMEIARDGKDGQGGGTIPGNGKLSVTVGDTLHEFTANQSTDEDFTVGNARLIIKKNGEILNQAFRANSTEDVIVDLGTITTKTLYTRNDLENKPDGWDKMTDVDAMEEAAETMKDEQTETGGIKIRFWNGSGDYKEYNVYDVVAESVPYVFMQHMYGTGDPYDTLGISWYNMPRISFDLHCDEMPAQQLPWYHNFFEAGFYPDSDFTKSLNGEIRKFYLRGINPKNKINGTDIKYNKGYDYMFMDFSNCSITRAAKSYNDTYSGIIHCVLTIVIASDVDTFCKNVNENGLDAGSSSICLRNNP